MCEGSRGQSQHGRCQGVVHWEGIRKAKHWRLDQLYVQYVTADQYANRRYQRGHKCGRRAAAPESGGVDDDSTARSRLWGAGN